MSDYSQGLELSFTPPQNFYMTIDKLKTTAFTLQRVQIPVISGEEQLQSTPLNPGRTMIPGQGLEYSVLSCDIICDKHFKNYKDILQWFKEIHTPEAHDQWVGKWADTMSNVDIIGTDAANTPLCRWSFIDAFPISLDGPMYDATMPDIEYLTSNVTFRHKYFTFTTYTNGVDNHDTI